jgi:flagellar protein FlgJ
MPGEIPPGVGLAAVTDPASEVRLQRSRRAVAVDKVDGGQAKQARLQKACQGFEAIFIDMVLREMRKTVPDDGLLPTSSATRTWRELFDNQLAETLASKQEMGLAKMLYQQLQNQAGGKKSEK